MRIYLDHAATSWPKRPGVAEAMDRYAQECGAPVGRGTYSQAADLQRTIERCRRAAAKILGAPSPERVIFAFNGTDALNLAILGICRAGDHVITSTLEHNSVLRPLRHLTDRWQIAVTSLEPQHDGRIDPQTVRQSLRPNTRLVVLTHASNVTGTIQPIAEVADVLRNSQALFLVDAAQTAGHLPLDATGLGIDLLACSGHKGLGGPLGTGLLFVRPELERELTPLRFGGTGSHSESDLQPDQMPDRYESGNHNAPGLVGLGVALDQIATSDFAEVRRQDLELTGCLIDGLRGLPNVAVHVPGELDDQLGVVSISVRDFEPQILATLLDQEFGVQTRAGLHCAPQAHAWLGTAAQGGTVRFSIGHDTTPAEIQSAVNAVRELTA